MIREPYQSTLIIRGFLGTHYQLFQVTQHEKKFLEVIQDLQDWSDN